MAKPAWVTLNKNSGAYNEQVDVSVITYTGRVNRGGALDIVTVDGSPVASEVVDLAQDSPGLLLIPYTQSLEVGWNGGSFANVMEWATNSPSVIGGTPTAGSTWEFVYNGSIYPVATGIVFPGDPGLVGLVTGKFNVTIPASNLLADRIISMPMSTTFRSGNLTRTFNVKQTGRPAYLVLEPASLSSEANTTHTSSFTIKCNDDLVWSQVNSLPAWMTLAKSSGTGGTSNSVTVKQNDYLAARSYVLLFKQTGGDEVQKSFPVTQVGSPLRVSFTPTSQELEYNDLAEKTVNVSTNPDNTWKINSKPDWIDITSGGSGATGNGVIKYKANQSNPNTTPRTSAIVLRNSTSVLTGFEITQKKLPAFVILDPTSVNVPATGQTVNIHVDCAPGIEWTAVFNKGTLNTAQITQSSGVGPGYVTIIVGNSKQETAGSGSVTVTQLTESATATITQNAGVKVYSEITITAYNYPTATAAGGTILPNYGYSQTWTWNGVAGTGGAITTGASLSFSGGRINTSNGNASVTSKGTSISNQTTFTTGTMTVRMNGKSASASAAVPQAGNYVVGLSLSGGAISYANISAGATSASPTITGSTRNFTFSSGSTTTVTPSATYGTDSPDPENWVLGSVQNGFTAVNSTTGVLTATHRGTTIGPARTSGVVTRKITVRWIPTAAYNSAGTIVATASMTATCTQEANSITAYGTPTGRTLAVSDIPASGGTVSSGTLGGTITQSRTYTSGSTDSVSNPTVSASSYSAAISANNLGTTIKSKTSIGTLTYYYTCNGIQGSVSATVYQAANAATSITYGTPSVSLAVSDIPASGGSISSGTVTYSQSRTQNYTSGGTTALSALTSGGSVSYSAAVSAASLGTTIKARTSVGTLTATVTMSGKSGSGSAIVYQQANTFSDNSMKLHFGSFTGANTITVGAGSSSTAVYLEVTRLYTSGVYQSGYNVTTGGTFTVSGTGFSISGSNVIAASRGTTAGAARSGTVTGKYSHLTATGTITQQENKVTNSNYNPRITAYGTPSVSIGSGITAAGGRATVTHSVTNTQTYNALYASGATGPDQTRSVAGTTTITLTGNGNSRFSLSGNIISHSSMGTNLTTDTVTVTATNSGQTSKTASASKSVTNGRAVAGTTGGVTTYGHVTAGSIINKTIPASGGSATATAGSGSQAWSKTAMVTSYEYDSGATSDATIENASSGTNTISPSVGSITASAASKGTTVSGTTTVKSQAVTWSGGGSKSASGTMYIYQAANEVVVRNNFIVTSFSYPNIVYSGGTVTPTATTVEYDAYYTSGATQTGYGLPPGGTLGYMSVSLPSGFSLNSTTGVVTAGANSSTSTRSATIRARVQYDGSIVASKDATVTQAGVPGPTRVNISINNPQLTGGEVVIAFSPACYDTLTILVMGYLQDGSLYSVYRNVGGGITEDRFYPNGAWADSASIENIDGEGIPPVTKTRGIYYW